VSLAEKPVGEATVGAGRRRGAQRDEHREKCHGQIFMIGATHVFILLEPINIDWLRPVTKQAAAYRNGCIASGRLDFCL
jgi:hypothetical protein